MVIWIVLDLWPDVKRRRASLGSKFPVHFSQDGTFLYREWAAAWRFVTKRSASAFVWIQRDGPQDDKLQKAPFLQADQPFRLFSFKYFFVQHTSYTAVWSGPAPTLWRVVLTWLKSIVQVVKDDSFLSSFSGFLVLISF